MKDSYEDVEKHLLKLQELKRKLDGISERYFRNSVNKEIKRQARAAGEAVKDYIGAGGDPQKIADYFRAGPGKI